MADIKPLGSEKLQGDEKLQRILQLTYYNEKNNKSNQSKPELVKESKSGGVYGIVKERDGYYVKRGLNESSLDYIGGMFMKNKNKFSSYAEAAKRLNLIEGQESLQEATKYVLKQNKPQEEAPMPAPSMDAPAPEAAPMDTTGMLDNPPSDDAPSEPTPEAPAPDMGSQGGEEESGEPKRSDYMAEVQKYAGKLGQELRDLHDRMESDDIKYVLNMIISAVDLDKLDDDDIEEIGKKFEREEENDDLGMGGDSESDNSPADDSTDAMPSPDSDLTEDIPMDKLEAFINSPVDANEVDLSAYADQKGVDEIDMSEYADLENEQQGNVAEHEKEIDLDEIKNSISQAVGETLSKYFN
jgi:hypothetical protein